MTMVCLLATLLPTVVLAPDLLAQQWRGRLATRWQFLDARPLVLDSVPVAAATRLANRSFVGDTVVSCAPGSSFCFFYRPGSVESTAPLVSDASLNVWDFGLDGLRVYGAIRLRGVLGSADLWPGADQNFELFAAYLELDRSRYRVRMGRDYKASALGYYGYDGGSLLIRLPTAKMALEAYGGWGLARGVPVPVNSDVLSAPGEFQPEKRNYLFGFQASARPLAGAALEALYQREISTDRTSIATEQLGFDAAYSPSARLQFSGYARYDLAAGWWGKAGVNAGWWAVPRLYVEGRIFRYRPIFSLQTIWVAFSPVAYHGLGLTLGLQPLANLSIDLTGERRQYDDSEAEVPFASTTDRTWRAGGLARWRPQYKVDIEAGYYLDFTFGAALSSGQGRVSYTPSDPITVALGFTAFQQSEEFRIDEDRVWSLGADLSWRTRFGNLWSSIYRYQHRPRGDATAVDWVQIRAELGWAWYLGPEPGGAF